MSNKRDEQKKKLISGIESEMKRNTIIIMKLRKGKQIKIQRKTKQRFEAAIRRKNLDQEIATCDEESEENLL